jgi:hypothetical protein
LRGLAIGLVVVVASAALVAVAQPASDEGGVRAEGGAGLRSEIARQL